MAAIQRTFPTFAQGGKLGILFSGGPASGANAVISSVYLAARHAGIEPVLFREGYTYLRTFNASDPHAAEKLLANGTKSLTIAKALKIRITGGIIIGTARANPAKDIKIINDLKDPNKTAEMNKVLDAFEALRIGALVSIGGDDTMRTAYLLWKYFGVPVVHVPKTIDKDYPGIEWTFGYHTAVNVSAHEIMNLMRDAQATRGYFIVNEMGRNAGWLTEGAGIAGGATLTITREEIEKIDSGLMIKGKVNIQALAGKIVDHIHTREKLRRPYGVIIVAEGVGELFPLKYLPRKIEKDEFGHPRLSEIDTAGILTRLVKSIYNEKHHKSPKLTPRVIGHEIRCADPISFDTIMASILGIGAVRLAVKGQFGQMVSLDREFELNSQPIVDLIDMQALKATGIIRVANRPVQLGSSFHGVDALLEWAAVNN